MARAPHKLQIVELENGRFCITPIIQSTRRRSREFDTCQEAQAYLWNLFSTSDDTYLVEYIPDNIVETPSV